MRVQKKEKERARENMRAHGENETRVRGRRAGETAPDEKEKQNNHEGQRETYSKLTEARSQKRWSDTGETKRRERPCCW